MQRVAFGPYYYKLRNHHIHNIMHKSRTIYIVVIIYVQEAYYVDTRYIILIITTIYLIIYDIVCKYQEHDLISYILCMYIIHTYVTD